MCEEDPEAKKTTWSLGFNVIFKVHRNVVYSTQWMIVELVLQLLSAFDSTFLYYSIHFIYSCLYVSIYMYAFIYAFICNKKNYYGLQY